MVNQQVSETTLNLETLFHSLSKIAFIFYPDQNKVWKLGSAGIVSGK